MQRLLASPLKDSRTIASLRQKAAMRPRDADAPFALAIALIGAGCTYEAALILRPIRVYWAASKNAQAAKAAIEVQAWWTKNWRSFVQLKNSGKAPKALALLGDRLTAYWDLPPLLVHLGEIAAEDGQLDVARHLYQRVFYLSERGLPKMNMKSFAYVSQAALADLLCKAGDAAAALAAHRAIVANPGNAMACEMQHARLLVAAGRFEEAMREAASILVTANKHRSGYSKEMRLAFIKSSPGLASLRKLRDWKDMLRDPDAFLRIEKKQQRGG